MKSYEMVNKFHSVFLVYLLFGGFFISQRSFLVFLIPSLQYQYLINERCILTQLEEKLLNDKNRKDKKKDIIIDSFVNTKMKEYNINIDPELREKVVHTILYCLFMGNYFTM